MKRKHHKKILRKSVEEKKLMAAKLRCLTCNRKAHGEGFINMIASCDRPDCPHIGKPLQWAKTAIGGNASESDTAEILEDQPLLPSSVNSHEEQPIFQFIYRDKIIGKTSKK